MTVTLALNLLRDNYERQETSHVWKRMSPGLRPKGWKHKNFSLIILLRLEAVAQEMILREMLAERWLSLHSFSFGL